mmetsp:Transcript_21956/g.39833  ORF Transcript_21956/g.39833 Transcript_21956/m.39833 type:complete len:268 (+) Transcript_21956:45-848(+)
MAAAEGMLLKVPRWLSDIWEKASESSPEAVLADLDLEKGKLTVLHGDGSARPVSLTVSRRASPELFAFSETEDGALRVVGGLSEVLHVKADLQDTAYRGMLQQRAEEATAMSGNRSVWHEKLQHPDQKPQPMRTDSKGSAAVDRGRVSLGQGSANRGISKREQAEHSAFGEGLLETQQVYPALKRHLAEAGSKGLTCEDLLGKIGQSVDFATLRDALVAGAQLSEAEGRRSIVLSEPPPMRWADAPGLSASQEAQNKQPPLKRLRQG